MSRRKKMNKVLEANENINSVRQSTKAQREKEIKYLRIDKGT